MPHTIARLYCKTGALAGSEYRIEEEATIGRGEENDITLRPESVSGRHAQIFFDDERGCYVLEDLDSSNGTQLDDAEVDEPVRMRDLHVITFAGKLDFIFQVVEEEPASSADESRTQLGEAPHVPSLLSEEPEAEQTQFGEASAGLPDLSEFESTSEEEEGDPSEEDPDVEQTRFGEAPDAPPDLTGEGTSSETDPDSLEEDEGSEVEHTQFGEMSGALPDLSEEETSSDAEESPSDEDEESEVEHTQFGEASGALPDLADEETSSEPETDSSEGGRSSSQDADAGEVSSPYALDLTSTEGSEETHSLPEGTITVGRAPACDVQIDDPGVSRQHAELIVGSDEVVLKDMKSKNSTIVDGERVTEPVTLSPGAEIQFGLQVKAVLRHTSR